jgi:hypothetical protein
MVIAMLRRHVHADGGARKMAAADHAGAAPTGRPTLTIRARDVMSRDMVVLPAWFGAADAVNRAWARHAAYPVVDALGCPIGVLGPAAAGGDQPHADLTLAQICRPLSSVPVLAPDDDIDRLLDLALPAEGTGALVVEDNRLVGVVSSGYLLRLARARAMVSGEDFGLWAGPRAGRILES